MLSNAYFLAKFRFDTAENEPAKNLQNFRKMHFRKMHFRKMHFRKMHFRKMHRVEVVLQRGEARRVLLWEEVDPRRDDLTGLDVEALELLDRALQPLAAPVVKLLVPRLSGILRQRQIERLGQPGRQRFTVLLCEIDRLVRAEDGHDLAPESERLRARDGRA